MYIARGGWVIPTVQSVHILCLSIVMASVAILNVRLLQLRSSPESIGAMAQRLLPWVWGAMGILALTGVILIIGEPARELQSWMFQLKMGLVALVCLLTAALQFILGRSADFWSVSRSRRQLARGVAIGGLTLWVGIVVCGRWIAYA